MSIYQLWIRNSCTSGIKRPLHMTSYGNINRSVSSAKGQPLPEFCSRSNFPRTFVAGKSWKWWILLCHWEIYLCWVPNLFMVTKQNLWKQTSNHLCMVKTMLLQPKILGSSNLRFLITLHLYFYVDYKFYILNLLKSHILCAGQTYQKSQN